jgi:hypothetical protein
MNSRERVHAALRRQPADRVPVFMWFHPATLAERGLDRAEFRDPFHGGVTLSDNNLQDPQSGE